MSDALTKADALWYAWGQVDSGGYPAEFDTNYGYVFRDWFNARRAAYDKGERGHMEGMRDMWRTFASAGRTDIVNEAMAVSTVMDRYRFLVDRNAARRAVALDRDGMYGVQGEVMDVAEELGFDVTNERFMSALWRASDGYQEELRRTFISE
jgi:hypothetical protein